jgi:RsiW-degrading membrane proteinase PrsW (M82 family)
MYPLSLAMAVIVPALLLLEYGLIKTRRPLLGEGLWGGFVSGVAVGVAVIAWELAFSWLLPLENLPPVPAAAGHALLIAALPEEALKYGATLLVARRFVYPGNVADVILTALGVAVGFAVAEDASYVINASAATGDGA